MTITEAPRNVTDPEVVPESDPPMASDDGHGFWGPVTVFIIFMAAAGAALVWALAGSGSSSSTAAVPATPVAVNLTEFHIAVGQTTLAPGKYSFHISNGGTVEHEMLVFQSDLPPSEYPMKSMDIDEEGPGVTLLSDGDNIEPGGAQTRIVDLSKPGTYLLVCNLPGHFHAGMSQPVTVR